MKVSVIEAPRPAPLVQIHLLQGEAQFLTEILYRADIFPSSGLHPDIIIKLQEQNIFAARLREALMHRS
jgi:hypothetical protein